MPPQVLTLKHCCDFTLNSKKRNVSIDSSLQGDVTPFIEMCAFNTEPRTFLVFTDSNISNCCVSRMSRRNKDNHPVPAMPI